MTVGTRGPVGKRHHQRLGHPNKANAENEPTTAPTEAPVIPEPNPDWHPVARQLYDSLPKSGQSAFYSSADWATAYTLAESISRDLQPKLAGKDVDGELIYEDKPISGTNLSAYAKLMNDLLMTEGSRRRVKVELQKTGADEQPDDTLAALESIRGQRSA